MRIQSTWWLLIRTSTFALEWAHNIYELFVQTLKRLLVQHGLSDVQIVVADGGWEVADDILKNPDFSAAVDIIG